MKKTKRPLKDSPGLPSNNNEKYALAGALVAIIGIFILDILTSSGWADWLLYALPILISSLFIERNKIIFLSCFCSILAVIGFFFSPSGLEPEIALINRLLGIGVFWIILFLILRHESLLDSLEFQVEERTADLNMEIAEHRRTEESLRRTDELFRIAADAAHLMVYYFNAESRYVVAVHGLKELTGYSPEEVEMDIKWWNTQIHPDDRETNRKMYKEAILSGAEYYLFEYRVHHKLCHYIYVRDMARFIRGDDGGIKHIVGSLIDISDQKKAEAALKRNMAELESLNRDLESFSYSISHDLRAPLRFVHGYVDMILKDHGDALNDEARRKFDIIKDSVNRMDQLILGILALSRAGRQELTFQELDMRSIAQAVIGELFKAADLNTSPEVVVKDMPPARGDRVLIRQVFANLISNAFKFTRNGERPRIEVGGFSSKGENTYYVKDNGAGFDMRYADRLFGLFQRLHSESQFEGTGAGLAIVQRIVHRHNGRIWAEGMVNKGATFYFSLPGIGETPSAFGP